MALSTIEKEKKKPKSFHTCHFSILPSVYAGNFIVERPRISWLVMGTCRSFCRLSAMRVTIYFGKALMTLPSSLSYPQLSAPSHLKIFYLFKEDNSKGILPEHVRKQQSFRSVKQVRMQSTEEAAVSKLWMMPSDSSVGIPALGRLPRHVAIVFCCHLEV